MTKLSHPAMCALLVLARAGFDDRAIARMIQCAPKDVEAAHSMLADPDELKRIESAIAEATANPLKHRL